VEKSDLMSNAIAWILFASPLIITALLIVSGERRGKAKRFVERQRMAAFSPGPYFSSSQNNDRTMISL
jgi:hypothetical protein